MPGALPALRMDLDFMPSPAEDRPGLLIRDPMGFSDRVLIVPPPLVALLEFFDGERTDADLRMRIYELSGQLDTTGIAEHLQGALDEAGFLENERYEGIKEERMREFAEAGVRGAAHAGTAYPDQADEIREWFAGQGIATGRDGRVKGIAAPHVSPEGGWASYKAAYEGLGEWAREKTFVVLGTSHYGEPDCFGLTVKDYETPWGRARTERGLVQELARKAPSAVRMEDYCHRVEHSIEFQVVFLQSLFGAGVKILPILVGPFAKGLTGEKGPESDEGVARFFDALAEVDAREGESLVYTLGVDMAHIGRRYGDAVAAVAGQGVMAEVEERDRERIARMEQGDRRGFWDLVRPRGDDLKWCGSAPLYTFLRVAGDVRGELKHYEQWNIDEASVVSFAAMRFVCTDGTSTQPGIV